MHRLKLAHLPTPLTPLPRLSRRLGCELWVKRDDATGGPEAGNKIRKLEYLVADAERLGATTLITCGGLQSNHARATAVVAAQRGLRSTLLLRDPDLADDNGGQGIAIADWAAERGGPCGNLFIDELVGAEVRVITKASYQRRGELLANVAAAEAAAGRTGYVIPEGGSNGIGSLGYVNAMFEVAEQLDGAPAFDVLVVAVGSGGTAAGIVLGATLYGCAKEVWAMAVCNDRGYFEQTIGRIMGETCAAVDADDELGQRLSKALHKTVPWKVDDRFKGPAYGVSTAPQRQAMIAAARGEGLILDPVYSGKAFYGLETCAPNLKGRRVLFVHTGGLPGLLADPAVLQTELRPAAVH